LFKPYYGIEAERVGRVRRLCASAILSPEVCYLREAVYRGFPSAMVLCEPPCTAYGLNPGMLSDRPRGRDLAPQRGNAHQHGGAFCWIKWSYVATQRKVAELERSRERLASNTSPLVGGNKGFRDVFEEGSFAGGYARTQTGYLPDIYFIRKDECGRAVRKLHQIHMAIKIEDLAYKDRHLLKPAAARTISKIGLLRWHCLPCR
jgi:hypothetical protein